MSQLMIELQAGKDLFIRPASGLSLRKWFMVTASGRKRKKYNSRGGKDNEPKRNTRD